MIQQDHIPTEVTVQHYPKYKTYSPPGPKSLGDTVVILIERYILMERHILMQRKS
jgi:hypothetical protein